MKALVYLTSILFMTSTAMAEPIVYFSGVSGTFNERDPVRIRATAMLSEKSDKPIEVPFEVHWEGMTAAQSGFEYATASPIRFSPGAQRADVLIEFRFKEAHGPKAVVFELKDPAVNVKIHSSLEKRAYFFRVDDLRSDFFALKGRNQSRHPDSITFSFEKNKN